MWSHVRSTKSLTADDFFVKNARGRARRDFSNTTIIFWPPPSPKVVRHGAPLFEMRAPATVPPGAPSSYAVLKWYHMLSLKNPPRPERVFISGQNHDRPHKKYDDAPCFLHNSPPNPPIPNSQFPPPLRPAASSDLPQSTRPGCGSRLLAYLCFARIHPSCQHHHNNNHQ